MEGDPREVLIEALNPWVFRDFYTEDIVDAALVALKASGWRLVRALEHERSRTTSLTVEDVMEMAETIKHRIARGDDISTAVAVVLFNFGDRFAKVWCINGEWTGTKKDVIHAGVDSRWRHSLLPEIPTCPNGHVLYQGQGLKLAWMDDEMKDEKKGE